MYSLKLILILVLSITVISFSCSKDYFKETRYNDTGQLSGIWNYASTEAQTQTSKEFNSGNNSQRSDALLNYVTENNKGEILIHDSVITMIDLGYTVSGNIEIYDYMNGVLKDSSQKPYNTSFSAPESLCSYKMSGDDSVTFTRGGFINIATPVLNTSPSGARISFKGDTLLFTENLYKDSSFVEARKTYTIVQTGTAVISMIRHA